MRQMTPLAPAIHLGAERILVIGVRRPGRTGVAIGPPPNMAEQFGFMLDSLFMEGLHADLERLNRINALLGHLRPGPAPLGMRHVETMLLLPERDPSEAAVEHRDSDALDAPRTAAGPRRAGARGGRLLSYLLFESAYTRELIDAGERDANARRAEIGAFLGLDSEFGAKLD